VCDQLGESDNQLKDTTQNRLTICDVTRTIQIEAHVDDAKIFEESLLHKTL